MYYASDPNVINAATKKEKFILKPSDHLQSVQMMNVMPDYSLTSSVDCIHSKNWQSLLLCKSLTSQAFLP